MPFSGLTFRVEERPLSHEPFLPASALGRTLTATSSERAAPRRRRQPVAPMGEQGGGAHEDARRCAPPGGHRHGGRGVAPMVARDGGQGGRNTSSPITPHLATHSASSRGVAAVGTSDPVRRHTPDQQPSGDGDRPPEACAPVGVRIDATEAIPETVLSQSAARPDRAGLDETRRGLRYGRDP